MDAEPILGPQNDPGPTPVPSPGDDNFSVDPAAIIPGEGDGKVRLGETDLEYLSAELAEICANYDTSMSLRVDRWAQINDAYNLVSDPDTAGDTGYSQRMVSEMTRSHVNIATARLEEGILETRPVCEVAVWDDQADDEETQDLVAEAEATETFFDSYFLNEMRARSWLPMGIHRATKLGGAVVRIRWQSKPHRYWYRGKGGKPEKVEEDRGRAIVDLIRNEQMIVWPLHQDEIEKCSIVGHRSYENRASFRSLAAKLGLDEQTVKDCQAGASSGDPSQRNQREDLRGKDINIVEETARTGEIPITELWLSDYVLPGKATPGNYQVFFSEPLGKVLSIGVNPYRCQRHHYFLIPYWREDGCIWPSGVGHELLWTQKTDSALWTLQLDNLKVVGNVLTILKSGNMADAKQDEIRPGGKISTEDPEADLRTVELGGDLSWILQAISANELRGQKADGLNNPAQGYADPVLKSGASPGSIQQLQQAAGQRFGKIDKNIRLAISDMCVFTLDLLQQFAPPAIYYERASTESAERMIRGKYVTPGGDLRSKFRITPKAASATSNREVMTTRVMLVYQLMSQQLPIFVDLVDRIIGMTNPAGAERLKQEMLSFWHGDLFRQVLESQEIAGLAGRLPKIEPPTPVEEVINQLLQQNAQLQEQLSQIAAQQFPQEIPNGAPPGQQAGLVPAG